MQIELKRDHKRVDRSWGYEIWYENRDEYCGKRLVIDPHRFGSLHFHMSKCETMLVERGTLVVLLVDLEEGTRYHRTLMSGQTIFIPRGQPHRLINDTDTPIEVIEFSSTHSESDSFRVEKGGQRS